ncbi:MAG TPA: penicillin-binding protein 2 [Geminicoccaceae bacterium]|nr:penicillin-binding protein 2 [Geminicoccus sp.]HMU50207.1 penicillin-binding protein 2 [Geminicoccaceae bacterium]
MRFLVPTTRPADPVVQAGRKRLRVVALCFAMAFASVGLRLVDMVVGKDPAEASPRIAGEAGPDPRRADIVDRNGELLATNLRVPSVFADPSLIPDIDRAADRLASALVGIDAGDLKRRLRAAKRFAWVKHEVTPLEQAAVLGLGIPGVGFRNTEKRVYPRERLTSHVVGFTDLDNQGLAGIEYAMQDRLVGGAAAGKEPVALSLDLRIQQIVHDEVASAFTRFRAQGAVGIVLDRVTGELLSLVSLPDFDPNRVDRATVEGRKNRATGNTYELGSLFKILSVAMALDTGKVSMADSFDATVPLRIGRHTIRDDHAKRRWLSVPEVFMYSSNIGTAKMVFAAGGADPLKGFFDRVGLMSKPSLEIPELARPQLPKRWADSTTATAAFGHSIAVTPLQFVDAVAAVAGDGTRVPPTLLRRQPGEQPERRRLVSARTAEDVRWLMWLTVAKGTGTRAKDPAYLIGGKTGTADKVDPVRGGYLRGSVIASFVGVFPIEAPRYVVMVMLDDPRGDGTTYGLRYGGWTAAPVVRDIVSRIGPVLGVSRYDAAAEERFVDRLGVSKSVVAKTQRKEERIAFIAAGR